MSDASDSKPVETPSEAIAQLESTSSEPPPSYVKLAMRNMVRKRGKSLYHFTLTSIALLTLLIGLSYLTR
ncbi:MAG: DUF3285 domain-containing protein [Cyanobacteria bacterium CRU_2_1]|nr:DUF3285 domain-containing protein [Cyanobacteria bacterium RU_5_0]NJR61617.1 DUF3285 domain-containing protein [Cyanobacteria bacterium CRU_2_1]